MKTCSKCKVEKPVSDFHKRLNRPGGLKSQCKDCTKASPYKANRSKDYMRKYDLNKTYGISVERYNELLNDQNNRCAICNKTAEEKMKGKKKYLCVDHDHETGQIRGLLCDPCNRAIGLLGEDAQVLQNAINYIN